MRLFEDGLAALRARDDQIAFAIFDVLSRYEAGAPPQLMTTAKMARDILDPERTADQKARAMLHFFSPAMIRVFPNDEGETALTR